MRIWEWRMIRTFTIALSMWAAATFANAAQRSEAFVEMAMACINVADWGQRLSIPFLKRNGALKSPSSAPVFEHPEFGHILHRTDLAGCRVFASSINVKDVQVKLSDLAKSYRYSQIGILPNGDLRTVVYRRVRHDGAKIAISVSTNHVAHTAEFRIFLANSQ